MSGRTKEIGGRVIAIGVAAIGIPSAVGFAVDKLQYWISRQLIAADDGGVALEKGPYLIGYFWLLTVFILIIFAIMALIWLCLSDYDARIETAKEARQKTALDLQQAEANKGAAEAQATAARDNLEAARTSVDMQEAYDQMCRSVQRVIHNAYNPVDPSLEPPPPVHFSSIDCVFDIQENGDAKVTQTYDIESAVDLARFWEVRLDGDIYADPFKTLKSIDFKASSQSSQHDVVAIPIDNEGFNRSVAIFFLPEIPKGERRRFFITFEWKGWFGELVETGATDWLWSYQSAATANTADVSFTFRFARKLGLITCENIRRNIPGETLTSSNDNMLSQWIYKNAANPAARLNWALRFRRG